MKKKLRNIFFLLPMLFGGLIYAYSQDKKNDLLENKSKSKAETFFLIGIKNQDEGNYAKSIEYFEESRNAFSVKKNHKKQGDCYSYIAISYSMLGDYTKSISFFEESIIEYKKIDYTIGISSVTNNIGGIYYYLGKFPQALEYYQKVLEIQKKLKEERTIAITTQNIGGIYSKIDDYSNALKYYNQALHVYIKLNDEKSIAQNLNSAAFIQIQLMNYTKALKMLNEAIKIADKKRDKQLKVEILLNLGEFYFKQSKFSKGLHYYTECLKISNEINSKQYYSSSKIAIGKIYNQFGKNDSAIKSCKSGLDVAENINSLSLKKEACDCLYDTYKSIGDNKSALIYFEKSNIYKDSLNAKETTDKMMSMELQNKQLLDSIAYVKKEHLLQLKHKEEVQKKEKQRNAIIASLGFILLFAIGLWNRLNFVKKSKKALQFEKDRSEELLLNILPEEIAEELKERGKVNARDFNLVGILFTDFKSFTETAQRMSPQELVEEINVCFKAFDLISEKFNIEKIKTIGDAYMAAGGIPIPEENFLIDIVNAGLEMQEFMLERKLENEFNNKPAFEMRLGIHTGPIVAGIVGVKKFQYDVWGDTVNTASRIESSGTVGKVNISESLYQLIKDSDCFDFEFRGNIYAKGKGNINMYFVEKKKNTNSVNFDNQIKKQLH